MRNVAIIGAGVVGTAIGYLLNRRGYRVVGIGSRSIESAGKARAFIGSGSESTDLCSVARKADIVFITTSDGAIRGVCSAIAAGNGFRKGCVVFHTCGALSSSVLLAAKKKGAYTASLHPLQSLASVGEAVRRLPGSFFSVEGDPEALAVAGDIISSLGGKEIDLKIQKKTLYHAGACAVSNYLVATVGLGLELFEAAGIGKKDSLKALMPLISGTVKNIKKLGVPMALTGPIARGDSGIIRDHLKAIRRARRDLTDLYCELGRYTVRTGMAKGTLKAADARKMNALFDTYQKGKHR